MSTQGNNTYLFGLDFQVLYISSTYTALLPARNESVEMDIALFAA